MGGVNSGNNWSDKRRWAQLSKAKEIECGLFTLLIYVNSSLQTFSRNVILNNDVKYISYKPCQKLQTFFFCSCSNGDAQAEAELDALVINLDSKLFFLSSFSDS